MTSTTGTTTIQIATQKADVVAEYTALVAGMKADLADILTFVLNDVTWTHDALVAQFEKRLQAAQTIKASRTTLQQAVADDKAVQKEVDALRNAMRGYLKARFGKNSPKLQKFGFTPNRTPKKAASVKAAAVVKAKATRVARGTKGTKQKAAIKGSPAPTASAPAAVTPAAKPATPPSTPTQGTSV
jgi:hypothetical protein